MTKIAPNSSNPILTSAVPPETQQPASLLVPQLDTLSLDEKARATPSPAVPLPAPTAAPVQSTTHATLPGDLRGELDIGATARRLDALWPFRGEATADFAPLAARVDAYKLARSQAIGSASPGTRRDMAAALRDDMEVLHRKAGSNERLRTQVVPLLTHDQALAADLKEHFGLDESSYAAMVKIVEDAAPWVDLGDVQLDTATLAGKEFLKPEQRRDRFKERAANAGALVAAFSLADEETTEAVRTSRLYVPYAGTDGRAPAAQVIDIAAQLSALSAVRFFRKDDVHLDPDKIRAELNKNALIPNEGRLLDAELVAIFSRVIDRDLLRA